jgi:uncharacterized protein YjgD (DUF1641 family)
MNTPVNEAVGTGQEIQRVAEAARDALTDEMVTRMAGTASDAMELLDQVNRTGLAKAIPALAQMVGNGDLDRLVQLARVYGSAEDALTDEMVGRVAQTVSEGMSLLDQVNRSGLEQAIPALSRMVADGDLDRLAQLARVYRSAEDALTDEMVGRLAETVGEGLSLIDRLNRGGAGRLIEMMERMEATGALERVATLLPRLLARMDMLDRMLSCFETAATELATAPAPRGGVGGLWALVRDPESQRTLQFMLRVGQNLRTHCLKASE